MKSEKYNYLREIYPEYISKSQLCRICKISPKSALYLLSNNIIPCTETGKQTWKYKIALNDVLLYLKKRDKYGSMIPKGAVTSRSESKTTIKNNVLLACALKTDIKAYYEYIYAEYPSIIPRKDVQEMTGLSKKTVCRLVKEGAISVNRLDNGKQVVSKSGLIDFVMSLRYLTIASSSPVYEKILGGFEIWKNAKF